MGIFYYASAFFNASRISWTDFARSAIRPFKFAWIKSDVYLIEFAKEAKKFGAQRFRYCDTLGYDDPKTAYDRNKTVSIQYYTRKATALREAKIRELTADLEKINAERKQFEEDYKHDLTKLREMKIKRANPNEIAKLEKDLKKNQKLSANLGLTVNKISNELSYAKTDAYLNNLIKKLEREQPSSNEETESK